jgi:flagellar hook-associated protein FlgK
MTDILGIGSSGLTAYRKLLETTGNNIANANTDGYVRRDVSLNSVGEAQMLPTAKNAASGAGVSVDLVRRASDAFLQSQVRDALSREASAQILSEGLVRLEKSVVAPEHNIGSTVEDFFARMQDLTLSPSSVSMRLTLIDAGQRVAERFRVTASSIRDEVTSTEAAMQTTLEGINTMTAQLASLNREISRSGSGPQKLNDLLDQRDKLLKDISKLVRVTVTEETSGEIKLYLGDSPSGPKLVDFDTSKDLGIVIDGDRINFVYDPYGQGSFTNQVTGGALAGQRDFRLETLGLLESANRLAVALADSINAQHRQGIDLKGAAGKDLFSTDSVVAIPASLNRGTAKVDISIETAAEVSDDTYTIRFDKTKSQWTARSEKTFASVSGNSPLRMDGLIFNIEGDPAEGDIFTSKPLADAAIGLYFLTDDPSAIAASMALYVDPASSNAGSGLLNLKRWDNPVPLPLAPPPMTSLFSPLIGDTLAFRRDGEAFTIPSGAKDVVLSSLGNVSAAHFTPENFVVTPEGQGGLARLSVESRGSNAALETTYFARFDGSSGEWVVTSDQTGKSARGDAVISLDGNQFIFSGIASDGDSFRIDSFSSFSKRLKTDTSLIINLSTKDTPPAPVTLGLSGEDTTPEGMANAINAAARSQSLGKAIFASVANGTLTINALAGYTINSAMLQGQDAGGAPLEMGARIEKSATASQLQVFTTEGRQLFTEAMDGWRDIDMDQHVAPIGITSVDPAGGSLIAISVRGEPLRDSALRGNDGSVTAGGVYALDIEGMQEIRLAGEIIAGKDNNGVANALAASLNSQASIRSWVGGTIDFTSLSLDEAHFRINIDGQANDITFRRARDLNGNLLATGSFEIDGPSDLSMALIPDSQTTGHIIFTLPKQLSTSSPQVDVNGADALLLGFQTPPRARLTAAGEISVALPQTIAVQMGDSPVTRVLINQIPGGTASGLSWQRIDGRLSIEAASSTIRIVSERANDRDAASGLGFFGTDLDLSMAKDDHGAIQIRLRSNAVHNVNYADASASISRIGTTVRIYEAVPEDLIVSLRTTTADSRRMIATGFPQDLARTDPQLGDISIKIIDQSHLEIIDAESGKTVALRPYVIGEVVEYLGLSFTLQAPVFTGDSFNIKRDDSRTGDNRNILAMTQLQKGDMFGAKRGSFQDVYASTAAKLGNASQSAATDESVASKAASDLQSAYDSKTGVSLDKEASDLIRFQQAYQAAAQVVMVARTMFDTILKTF